MSKPMTNNTVEALILEPAEITDALMTPNQWDTGLDLIIEGLSFFGSVVVQFWNQNTPYAYSVEATVANDGTITARIPNLLLQEAKQFYAAVTLNDSDYKASVATVRVTVRAAKKPTDYHNDDPAIWITTSEYQVIKEAAVNDLMASLDARQDANDADMNALSDNAYQIIAALEEALSKFIGDYTVLHNCLYDSDGRYGVTNSVVSFNNAIVYPESNLITII